MVVQTAYLLALAVWLGGMIVFGALFAPSLTAVLDREASGRVISVFLDRFKVAVGLSVMVITATSAIKFFYWENVTPWLLLRWLALGGMTGLALYDFLFLAPRLKAARETGDKETFARFHNKAVRTMGMSVLLGLVALFFS